MEIFVAKTRNPYFMTNSFSVKLSSAIIRLKAEICVFLGIKQI